MTPTGNVTSDGLKLRRIPGGKVLDELAHGEDVLILEQRKVGNTQWMRVKVDRTEDIGWVAARYIQLTPAPIPVPVPVPVEPEHLPPQPWWPTILVWAALIFLVCAIIFASDRFRSVF